MIEIFCMFLFIAIPYILIVGAISGIGAIFKGDKNETKK